MANHCPVRQNPVWISSATNNAPFAVHHRLRAGRNPGAGTTNPPSPWMGSTGTHGDVGRPDLRLHKRQGPGGGLLPSSRRDRNGYDMGTR